MIQLINGSKGSGKTKKIIDMANDSVDGAKGDIVFVSDTDRYMYSIRYQIRFINTTILLGDNEQKVSEDSLIGFIKGVLAANHDIEAFYLDGAHRMLGKEVQDMESFFNKIYDIAHSTETRFFLTVSEDEGNFPEFLKKFENQ